MLASLQRKTNKSAEESPMREREPNGREPKEIERQGMSEGRMNESRGCKKFRFRFLFIFLFLISSVSEKRRACIVRRSKRQQQWKQQ